MRAIAIGLLLGVGLFCIWWSAWPRQPVGDQRNRPGVRTRLQDDINQAGYTSVSPGNVLTACAVGGVLVFALVQASTRVAPAALCFAAMAAYAPLALVRARACQVSIGMAIMLV